MVSKLERLCAEWEEWAAGADQSEEGWQSDFADWTALMDSALIAMKNSSLSTGELRCIELCWAISEESEWLADCAREDVGTHMDILRHLSRSPSPAVRWQAFDVLGFDGREAVPLVQAGLTDSDLYCRRRAVLALARLGPVDAERLATELSHDDDPYVRQASLEMARASKDKRLITDIAQHLKGDPADHVREAASRSIREVS